MESNTKKSNQELADLKDSKGNSPKETLDVDLRESQQSNRALLIIFGVLLCISAAMILCAIVGDIAEKHIIEYSGLLFAVVLGCGGICLFRKANALRNLENEQLILKYAISRGGKLSVCDAAADCQLPVAETQAIIERLARIGACHSILTPDGDLFFQFPILKPETAIEKTPETSQ